MYVYVSRIVFQIDGIHLTKCIWRLGNIEHLFRPPCIKRIFIKNVKQPNGISKGFRGCVIIEFNRQVLHWPDSSADWGKKEDRMSKIRKVAIEMPLFVFLLAISLDLVNNNNIK